MNALLLEPSRPRLPPELARSLSKLAGAAHRFHRWAHHPLCAAYRGEVLALGRRVRVCRGCAYVALGLVSGVAAAVAFASIGAWGYALVAAGALLAAISTRARLPKLLGRFVPAGLLGAAVAGGWGAALASAVTLAVAFTAYRARAPNRAPCEGCPQRELKVCDGVRPIVLRERAVMRLSAARLRRHGL